MKSWVMGLVLGLDNRDGDSGVEAVGNEVGRDDW